MQAQPEPDDIIRPAWESVIPDHWEMKRVKHVARFTTGWTPPSGDVASYTGENPWATIGDLGPKVLYETTNHISDEAAAKSATPMSPEGSLLFSFKLSVGQVSIAGRPVFTNEAIATFAPEDGYDTRWAFYAFPEFIPENSAINIYGARLLNKQRINDAALPFPPLEWQRAIAFYLDAETERIDGLIEDKQSLVATLKEMRRISVAEAITKGVRGARSMQPSGLSWVASIPADWRTLSLKRFVRLSGGHTPSTGNPAYWDGSVPWFSPKDMKADELLDSIDHVTELAVEESGLHIIEPGTAMIVVRGMILAHTFPVCVTQVKATINQDMKALVPEDGVHQRFLPWLLRGSSALFLSLTEQSAHGTMALRTDRFMGEKLPIPPLAEQIEIVEHLEAERQRIDLLVQQINEEIGLLRELRAATIADAVLGHIDVREYIKS